MAGHRPSPSSGLRLVSIEDRAAARARSGDGRPTVLHVVGTARDRLLLSPLVAELRHLDVARQVVVAVGAEDDVALTGIHDLALADRRLPLDGGTPTHRLAALLSACERTLDEVDPELVVVAGDGDAGLAAGLAAAKRGIAVAHVESGIRHPGTRQAELHRALNDRLADTLLAPTAREADNLVAEGIPDTRVHVVGQLDVDVLRRLAPRARARRLWADHALPDHGFVLAELSPGALADPAVARALGTLAGRVPVAARLDATAPSDRLAAELRSAGVQVVLAPRLLDQLSLLVGAGAVVTDRGIAQDATSALGVPCHTLGASTDRPHTLTAGTNRLLGDDAAAIAGLVPAGRPSTPNDLPPWDGRAAQRAARVLIANHVLMSPRREIAAP